MTEYFGCVHLIARVASPADIIQEILQCPESECAIIDLSAGQLNTPSRVREEVAPLLTTSKKNVQWIDGQKFAPEVGDTSREAYVRWLATIANDKLAGGKSIKEWFVYKDEVSLWWFTKMSEKHPSHHPYRWLFYQIHVLKHLNGQHDFRDIHWYIWADDEAAGKALQAALPSTSCVTVHVVEDATSTGRLRERCKRWMRSTMIGEILLALGRGGLKLARNAKELFREVQFSRNRLRPVQDKHTFENRGKGSPLVLIQTRFPKSWKHAEPFDRFDDDVSAFDRYFGDAPWRLQESRFDVAWLPTISYSNYARWEKARKEQTLGNAAPWMVLSWRAACEVLYHQLKWILLYVWLFVIKGIQEKWVYDDIPLGYWLKQTYASAVLGGGTISSIPIVDIEKYRCACDALEPDAVLYRDEFYPSGGRRVTAALKGRSRLIAAQHGMISRDHTVYQWHSSEIKRPVAGVLPDHVHYAPAPDWLAAFGSYYVDLFDLWNGYPAEHVIPIGGLRHDVLVEQFGLQEGDPRSAGAKEALREQLELPKEIPVLLLCTGLAAQAGAWFHMVVEALQRENIAAFVAVKLHQYHGGEVHVRHIAQERDFRSFGIYNEAIYPLMAASDLLITGASTTILEANLFGLSAIAIVANEEYENYPFASDGLAETVTGKGEMARALRNLVSDDEKIASSRSGIERHLRNLDGRACQRLASHIERCIEIDINHE